MHGRRHVTKGLSTEADEYFDERVFNQQEEGVCHKRKYWKAELAEGQMARKGGVEFATHYSERRCRVYQMKDQTNSQINSVIGTES